MLLTLALLVSLAILGPLFGADSRDGLDWARNHFWLRRRSNEDDDSSRPTGSRTSGSPGHSTADPGAAAGGCRTAPAAG